MPATLNKMYFCYFVASMKNKTINNILETIGYIFDNIKYSFIIYFILKYFIDVFS